MIRHSKWVGQQSNPSKFGHGNKPAPPTGKMGGKMPSGKGC